MRWPSLLVIVIAMLGGPSLLAQTARTGLYRLELTVNPRQVPADGKSPSRLRVVVRDQRGRPAPDGTPVVVQTDLGFASPNTIGREGSITLYTAGGFASAVLTSSMPGTASVTVQVADSRSITTVEFLPEGESAAREDRVVDVKGQWVGYSMDLGLIEARDRVTVRFGRLMFEIAGMAQVEVEGLILRAHKVVIRRGESVLEGEDLYFNLTTKRGVLRRFGEEKVERVYFDALGMRPLEKEWDIPYDAFRFSREEADSWLVARSISFFPREKIVLRHGTLWAQEKRVLRLAPLWIIGLSGYSGMSSNRALGVSGGSGFALDFPFFYRVTDQATGSIKLQHGAESGAYTTREGWSLGLEEEYRTARGVDGSVEVSGLPHGDWGWSWRDSRPLFGGGFVSTTVQMPDHRGLFADSTFYKYQNGGRLGVRAYYEEPDGYETTYGLVTDWLTDPRPIGGHRLSYRYGVSLGGKQYNEDPDPVLTSEVYSELSLGTRSLGKSASLSPTLTNVYSWDSSGYGLNSLRADLRLNRRFGQSVHLGLDYGAEWLAGDHRTPEDFLQTCGLDLRANHGSKWMSAVNASYDITNEDLYTYAYFDYYFKRDWRWGVRWTYYDYSDTIYRDTELSVARRLGDREVSLMYSTESDRVWISLGGFGLQ